MRDLGTLRDEIWARLQPVRTHHPIAETFVVEDPVVLLSEAGLIKVYGRPTDHVRAPALRQATEEDVRRCLRLSYLGAGLGHREGLVSELERLIGGEDGG